MIDNSKIQNLKDILGPSIKYKGNNSEKRVILYWSGPGALKYRAICPENDFFRFKYLTPT